MATATPSKPAAARLGPGAVLAISVVLLAIVIVAVVALATNLLGVPTTYGNGVNSSLGAQVAHDFLADQDAEASALSNGDQSVLGGRLTDSALSDVIQQISSQSGTGSPPAVSFHPTSLTILRAADPTDPSLLIEVQEDGTKSVVTGGGADSAPTEQTISFHGDFWLRNPSGSHYTIADQHIQTLPSSPLPVLSVVGAAVLFVGLATLLVLRQRRPQTPLAPVPSGELLRAPGRTETPVVHEVTVGPPPEIVVSTFGGLHVRDGGGRDWARALQSRTVTGFVWLRLLVAAIQDPAAPPSRDEVARQANPSFSRDVQLKRLRNVIAKGLPGLPLVLRDRILVSPEAMSFKLEGCEVDAIELLKVSAESAGRHELLGVDAARIDRVLASCQGAFLPEFETFEDLATDHHPTCMELIRELRDVLINKRVDLSVLLADTYLPAGRTPQAIAILEPAVDDRPQRKDVVDRLATAYRRVGRDAEAAALDARFA